MTALQSWPRVVGAAMKAEGVVANPLDPARGRAIMTTAGAFAPSGR